MPVDVKNTQKGRYCGAKKRQGEGFCKQRPLINGNGRCKFHGGRARQNKRNNNAVTHGIYADGYSDEEKKILPTLSIDSVDDEIRLCKIKVRRAMIARKVIDAAPNSTDVGFEVSEVKTLQNVTHKGSNEAGQNRREVTRKRPDYDAVIDRFLGRLNTLLRTRSELLGVAAKDPTDVARQFRDAMDEIERQIAEGND